MYNSFLKVNSAGEQQAEVFIHTLSTVTGSRLLPEALILRHLFPDLPGAQ